MALRKLSQPVASSPGRLNIWPQATFCHGKVFQVESTHSRRMRSITTETRVENFRRVPTPAAWQRFETRPEGLLACWRIVLGLAAVHVMFFAGCSGRVLYYRDRKCSRTSR